MVEMNKKRVLDLNKSILKAIQREGGAIDFYETTFVMMNMTQSLFEIDAHDNDGKDEAIVFFAAELEKINHKYFAYLGVKKKAETDGK
jgi:hypothetical protein